MKATITSIELKSPLKFFALSSYALKIMKQFKTSNIIEFKKRGFWTKHYTMSLWKNELDMKSFAMNGAHLEAMKKSRLIAKEIRIITIDADKLPDWKSAISLLDNAKIYKY